MARILALAAVFMFAMSASADVNKVEKWKKRAARLRQSCGSEVQKFCKEIPDGKEQYRCVFLKQSQLSPVCQSFVASIRQKIAVHKEKMAKQQSTQQQVRTPASSNAPKSGT